MSLQTQINYRTGYLFADDGRCHVIDVWTLGALKWMGYAGLGKAWPPPAEVMDRAERSGLLSRDAMAAEAKKALR